MNDSPLSTLDIGQDIMLSDYITYDGMSIIVRPDISLEIAGVVFDKTFQVYDWSQFYIGDLLNFCNDKFGEDFAQIVDPQKYRPKTLQKFGYVADRIAPEDRREELSYSIHCEVVKLDPESQRSWLQMAIDDDMTVDDLREALGNKQPPKVKEPKIIHVPCPECKADIEVSEDDFK